LKLLDFLILLTEINIYCLVSYFIFIKKNFVDWTFVIQLNLILSMQKQNSARRNRQFTSKMDIKLWKQLWKCYIWSVNLCGAENLTLQEVDRKYLESFKMWLRERMEKICWIDGARRSVTESRGRGKLYKIWTERSLTGFVMLA